VIADHSSTERPTVRERIRISASDAYKYGREPAVPCCWQNLSHVVPCSWRAMAIPRTTGAGKSRHSRYLAAELAVLGVNNLQCPSETTSTLPSVTLMAVWSSIAYVGAGILAAHCSAMAMSW
jgi:hypothetical protein